MRITTCVLAVCSLLAVSVLATDATGGTKALSDSSALDPDRKLIENLQRSEYDVREYDQDTVGGGSRYPQAANRAQDLRIAFGPNSVSFVRRSEAVPSWTLRLTLVRLGFSGATRLVETTEPVYSGRTVTLSHQEVVEEIVNTEQGVVLHLTLPTKSIHEEAVLVWDVQTDLTRSVSRDGSEVSFYQSSMRVARLRILRADDPGGRTSHLTNQGDGRLLLHIAGGPSVVNPGEPRAATGSTQGTSAVSLLVEGPSAGLEGSDGLSSTPAWVMRGEIEGALFGASVSTAGDVNGDGLSDVVIGAPGYDNGRFAGGAAFVFLGHETQGLASSPDWVVYGEQDGVRFGEAVSTAGDVNCDGHVDLVVAAPDSSQSASKGGAIYVFYGSSAGFSESNRWFKSGDVASARLGRTVALAGDVDGDGCDDVIAGANSAAYVFLGGVGGVQSIPYWSHVGPSQRVGSAGDVNGDGYDDILLSNPRSSSAPSVLAFGSPSGIVDTSWSDVGFASAAGDVDGDGYGDVVTTAGYFAKVWYGSASGLTGGTALPVYPIPSPIPDSPPDLFPTTGGDINGDGYADVVIGVPPLGGEPDPHGGVVVFTGSSAGPSQEPVWIVEGPVGRASFASSLATAGDVNGDGFSDLLVGASEASGSAVREGAAFLYLGAAEVPSRTADWYLDGNDRSRLGTVVGSAGDINNDGYSDVAVSSLDGTFVYLGTPSGLSALTLGWTSTISGTSSAAGDVNGDGYEDFLVGQPSYNGQAIAQGRAVLYLGCDPGSASCTNGLTTDPAWSVAGENPGDRVGRAVSSAGDVNGDGFADFIIGSPGQPTTHGEVRVYYGCGAASSSCPTSGVRATPWSSTGPQNSAAFGFSVGAAGDVNGDGFSDIVVGAPGWSTGSTDGRAVLYLGTYSGLSSTPAWTVMGSSTEQSLGITVAGAGDVNGDGYSDVIIGTSGSQNEAVALVYLGSAAGLSSKPDWRTQGSRPNARHLPAAAGAGDVNGDGYSDVIVGAPDYDFGTTEEGQVKIYLGSSTGLSSDPAWGYASGTLYANLGTSVAAAGDVNGDGFGDVIMGAPGFEASLPVDDLFDNGRAFLFLGGGRTGLRRSTGQFSTSGSRPIKLLGKSDATSSFRLQGTIQRLSASRNVSVEWEVKPAGVPFDGRISGTSSQVTAAGPLASFSELVTVPGTGTFHWRVRLASPSPFFPRTPWVSLSSNGMGESKLRVGVASQAQFGLIAPADSQAIDADSSAPTFVWNRGQDHGRFVLQFCSDGTFGANKLTSEVVDVTDDIGVYAPEESWSRVLLLGRYPDPRPSPIFWRIVSADGTGTEIESPIRKLLLNPARPPRVLSPLEGQLFRASDSAPIVRWAKDHNSRFELRFASNSALRGRRIVVGGGFELTSDAVQIPPQSWMEIAAMSRDNVDGSVFVCVFAKDALDRQSWSSVIRLRVLTSEGFAARPPTASWSHPNGTPGVKAQTPRIVSPEDGQSIGVDQPAPLVRWQAPSGARFELHIAKDRSSDSPIAVVGKGFTLTGKSVRIPEQIWAEAVDSALHNGDARVCLSVLSRSPLGGRSQSEGVCIVILPGDRSIPGLDEASMSSERFVMSASDR